MEFCIFSGVYNQHRKLKKMPSVLNDIEVKAMSIDPRDHSYPFENLIFEGGGNKGLAYCGAVRVRVLAVLYFYKGRI